MSDAIEIASTAPEVIECLLTDMFAGDHPDNEVVLGTLTDDRGREIQVQLRVTHDKNDFLDN